MASNNEQQQMNALQELFPNVPQEKINRLLKRFHGDVEKVSSHLARRDARQDKLTSVEENYAAVIATLQQEFPDVPRFRLLRIVERFNGDLEQIRQRLQQVHERHGKRHEHHERHGKGREHFCHGRRERREELQIKYADQLAELTANGVDTKSPWILRLLERNQGDVNKVAEIIARRKENVDQHGDLETQYASQIAELQASGVEIKNPRILARLLRKADGQVEVVKQLINERGEKHRLRREYREKHRSNSAHGKGEESACRKRRDFSVDDLENLKRLRSAGVHGHPARILELFHECNDSIELTIARREEQREERCRDRQEQCVKRKLLQEVQKSYLTINNREDWPENIEQVYLDGNNMMFVVDSLRRLCLNRAGKKTERAIGEIASAWNEKMHIPNVDLVFDLTNQLESIGTVKVSSAQPKYKTTDDMLVEIARQPSNQQKNKRTIIVTSDRALAALLLREGCILVKPYSWFAHCVMVLSPDLINYEEVTGLATTTATPTTVKTRFNFDQLVQRFANIDL